MITLSKTQVEDLDTLFTFQSTPEGIQMAAFTPENPFDKEFYITKWTKIVLNPDIMMQTIWMNERIVGSVVHFDMMNETNVSYWIDKPFWGQGIATNALQLFLTKTTKRPLYARIAFDNYGSQRVVEKCGFKHIAEDYGYANVRKQEIKEFIYRLDD